MGSSPTGGTSTSLRLFDAELLSMLGSCLSKRAHRVEVEQPVPSGDERLLPWHTNAWYILDVLTNARVRWTAVLCALSVAVVLAAGISVSNLGVSDTSPDKAETIVAIIDDGEVEAGRLSPWLISSRNDACRWSTI